MTIEIIEILRRANQGMTEPFICRADDGRTYFVKGKKATKKGLINEFLGSKLGEFFGIPVPENKVLWSDPDFLKSTEFYNPEFSDLGTGSVFGSLRVEDASEINFFDIQFVPKHEMERIVVFDCWVRNSDRTLTVYGGNPNLLWNVSKQKIFAIDHNLAFDGDLTKADLAQHIFIDSMRGLVDDEAKREQFTEKFRVCYAELDGLFDEIPDDWLYVDAERSIATNYDFDRVRAMLSAGWGERFWDDF